MLGVAVAYRNIYNWGSSIHMYIVEIVQRKPEPFQIQINDKVLYRVSPKKAPLKSSASAACSNLNTVLTLTPLDL